MNNNVQITFEELDMISGGETETCTIIFPFVRRHRVNPLLRDYYKKKDEPKDGGATGSW
jgi:hypothetical protein